MFSLWRASLKGTKQVARAKAKGQDTPRRGPRNGMAELVYFSQSKREEASGLEGQVKQSKVE